MRINNDKEYHEKEMQLFMACIGRIRMFLAVMLFSAVIIVNYVLAPSFLVYPWVLCLYFLYTVWSLIYPFSVFGYFGKKAERRAKAKLVDDVNDYEDRIEDFEAKMRREMQEKWK